jgi:adenosylhomocysteinase
MKNGRRIYLLADGRLVNLACAEGHPACVMDMSFAGQALSTELMVKRSRTREPFAPGVHDVPESIDLTVASLKLRSMGVAIDKLTPEQVRYLSSWEQGT